MMRCCASLILVLVLSLTCSVPTQQGQVDRLATEAEGQQPKQERRNRLVPDFKPFHHPSSKVSDSRVLGQGPISSVQWLELVPVFGNLHNPPPPNRTTQSNKLIIILGAVGGGTAVLLGYFFFCKSNVDDKEERRKEQLKRRDTLLIEEQIGKDHTNQLGADQQRQFKFAQAKQNNQEFTDEVIKILSEESPKPVVRRNKAAESGKCPELIVTESESNQSKFVVENRKGSFKGKNESEKHLEKETKKAEVKTSKSETNKKEKEKSRKISYARQISSEDGEFESKVKSFKLSKVPKTHSCNITEHGVLSEVLNILDVVELQRCEKLNTAIKGALADLSIEGANLSRLRITDVQEKGESEFVSKTMTIKEYMVSIANKKIEDAVKMVREDCSLENIKNLADTIKKYRPETNASSAGI